MTTAIYTHDTFLLHQPGLGHPESAARLRSILDELAARPVPGTERRTPRQATDPEVALVHADDYRAFLASIAGKSGRLDADTAVSPQSYDAALLAAGAAVEAVQDVWSGRATNAFALVRPPGHHAERTRAMGFCLVNNVAVAAEAARRLGAARVLVLDWDVHHGNGTQHTFAARSDVLFMSAHQYPFYPGSGAPTEVGSGAGGGFTVNCALPAGQTDADYGVVFHELFLPIGQAFRPDMIVVSAGFDPHERDPIGDMRVTERGFAGMCSAVKDLADETCGGKLVLVLEGGYHLEGLAASVRSCLEVMTGRRENLPGGSASAVLASLSESKSALRRYWPTL